jgi:hypothetical protein
MSHRALVLSTCLLATLLGRAAAAGVPYFDANSPINKTLKVEVGQTLTFTVTAIDPWATGTVSLSMSGIPFGATTTPQSPIYGGGNPVSMTFNFTPAPMHLGATTVTFLAQDQYGLSKLGPVYIHVVSCTGSATAYGSGCTGGVGAAPSLQVDGCPAPGKNLTLRVAGGPANGMAFLLFSPASGQGSFSNGCPLLLASPITAVPVALNGAGSFEITSAIPAFAGSLRAQAVVKAQNGSYATSAACTINVQ